MRVQDSKTERERERARERRQRQTHTCASTQMRTRTHTHKKKRKQTSKPTNNCACTCSHTHTCTLARTDYRQNNSCNIKTLVCTFDACQGMQLWVWNGERRWKYQNTSSLFNFWLQGNRRLGSFPMHSWSDQGNRRQAFFQTSLNARIRSLLGCRRRLPFDMTLKAITSVCCRVAPLSCGRLPEVTLGCSRLYVNVSLRLQYPAAHRLSEQEAWKPVISSPPKSTCGSKDLWSSHMLGIMQATLRLKIESLALSPMLDDGTVNRRRRHANSWDS